MLQKTKIKWTSFYVLYARKVFKKKEKKKKYTVYGHHKYFMYVHYELRIDSVLCTALIFSMAKKKNVIPLVLTRGRARLHRGKI